jgi:hypothetical protein
MWMEKDDRLLEDFILAPKKPEPLGGMMETSNFQEEEIISYHQTTGGFTLKRLTGRRDDKRTT